jgi:hypothetical protein
MKQRYTIFFTLSLIFTTFFSLSDAFGQSPEIVVSEYKDSPGINPASEWMELLVTKDNLTLVNYTIRDNSGTDSWQGGIRFLDIPLWKNLRAGTIIVIHHRDPANPNYDKDTKDGYLEVSAFDQTIFDRFLDNAADFSGIISLNASSDIVQIRDASNNHVHALAHNKSTDADFLAIQPRSLNHSSAGTGFATRVYPGLTLEDYYGDNASDRKSVSALDNSTQGKPNKNNANQDNNQAFWRKIREPEWNNPAFTSIVVTMNNVKLNWTPMTDPNPSDNIQGYMIMTTDDSDPDTNRIPVDGTTYVINQKIGNWRIVDIVPASQTTYDDPSNFENIACGGSYKYRVYAFRFEQDQVEKRDTPEREARGRQYLTDRYAVARAYKPAMNKPNVTVTGAVQSGEKISACQGKTITFSSTPATKYQWYRDNNPIPNQTASTLAVTQSGKYYVEVTNDVGCTAQSDEFMVEIIPVPVVTLNQGKTAKLCAGETLNITASGAGPIYTWFKDNVVISGQTTNALSISQPGVYKVSGSNSIGCADTSETLTVTARETKFTISQPNLDFGQLDGCTSSKTAATEFTNTGKDTVHITKVDVTTDFTVVSPLPITIAPNEKKSVFFRFNRPTQGISNGTASVTVSPCTTVQPMTLKGEKLKSDFAADRGSITFAEKLTCEIAEQDSVFNIDNTGNDVLTLIGYPWNLQSPFRVVARIPDREVIQPGSSIRIRVNYSPPSGEGNYSDELKIPFESGACKDTIRLVLTAQRKKPVLTAVNASELIFTPLLGCDKEILDSVAIRNDSKQPLFIAQQLADTSVYSLRNIPDTIKPGAIKQLHIRFRPSQEGDYVDSLPLFVDGCSDTALVIKVRGTKKSAAAVLSQPSIAFADVFSCDTLMALADTITLSLANFPGAVTIDDISMTNVEPFSINLTKGQTISDGEKIIVRFSPRFDRSYTDNIRLRLQPCDLSLNLPVSGTRKSSVFSWTKSFDFGTVDTGQQRSGAVVFKNTSRLPITLKDLDKVSSPPFIITVVDKPFPALINPGDSAIISIEYSPKTAVRDSIIANFVISAPCDTIFTLNLKGLGRIRGNNPNANPATLLVQNTKAIPGENFTFSVSLQSPDTAKFSLMKVYRLELDLTYNGSVMMPLSVKVPQNQLGYQAQLTETAAGAMKLIVTHPQQANAPTFIADGRLVDIEALAMLGDAATSDIAIVNDNIAGNALKATEFTYEKGILTLTDVCNLNGRLVKISGTPGVRIASLSRGIMEIHFENVSTDYTSVEIYSSMGEKIMTATEGNFAPGTHSAIVQTSTLANGAYYLVYKAGIFTYTLPFMMAY